MKRVQLICDGGALSAIPGQGLGLLSCATEKRSASWLEASPERPTTGANSGQQSKDCELSENLAT